MNMYTKRIWVVIIAVIVFLVCLFLVINGQRTVGFPNLLEMLIGLAGILALLFLYNRPYRERKDKLKKHENKDYEKE